jgi:hypothetical protein
MYSKRQSGLHLALGRRALLFRLDLVLPILACMDNLLARRFKELSEQAALIEASKKTEYNAYSERHQLNVDPDTVLGWKVKTKNLLEKACGKDSPHVTHFAESESGFGTTLE